MEAVTQRVLVVDDEPVLLKMMSMCLVRQGFKVFSASTTEKAWAAFAAAPCEFDVAVVDGSISGPGLVTFAKRMLDANPRLGVIAASGYPLDVTAVNAVAPGRAMFLQKPFTSGMLEAAVRRMIATQEKKL